jgi:hypothetical protein
VVLSELLLKLDLVLKLDRLAMDSVTSFVDIYYGLLGVKAVYMKSEGSIRDVPLII